MPRKNKKGGKGRGGYLKKEDSFDDNVSDSAVESDNGFSSASESDITEYYEHKFIEGIESATEKSVEKRTQGLQSICETLMRRYIPDCVHIHKITLIECAMKSMRRGKIVEQDWATRLVPLVLLQLGGDAEITKKLNQRMITFLQNESVPWGVRAKCCLALGVLVFLDNDEIADLPKIMQIFEGIFGSNYPGAEEPGALEVQGLFSWGLALTKIRTGDFPSLIKSGQPMHATVRKLMNLLQSPYLDVRIAAGETLALVFECGRSCGEDFLSDYRSDLIVAVKELATDSHKFHAKRDRKLQRATFREILSYLEEGKSPERNMRFGNEYVLIDSWACHRRHSQISAVLGPGMTAQLKENDFIRDMFQPGEVVVENIDNKKRTRSKSDRQRSNASSSKGRTKERGKRFENFY